MTRLSRILCAVDSSEPAQAAFRHSLVLSRERNADLVVVVAVPTNEPFNRRARQRIAKIAALRRASAAAGVRLRVSVQHGDPAGVILLHASSMGCDLIVIGTHRRSGLERLRAGSVAEQVARRATCPVLVVLDRSTADADRSTGAFQHVVCPVDFSAVSNAALDQALEVVRVGRSRLTLVHVVPDFDLPDYRRFVTHDAWRRLQASVPLERRATIDVRGRVVSGTPAQEIARLVTELKADLVVMGVTSRGAFGRRLFKSTAVRVMRSADCPVLAVPGRTRTIARWDIESPPVATEAA